jgi:hypothetical protein
MAMMMMMMMMMRVTTKMTMKMTCDGYDGYILVAKIL